MDDVECPNGCGVEMVEITPPERYRCPVCKGEWETVLH